jgi:hypothetical protein
MLEWDFSLEELPPMGVPEGMLTARGNFTVKPEKTGPLAGLVQWICTLRGTYTVPKGQPRRLAYIAFTTLWNFRMRQSVLGSLPADIVLTQVQNAAHAAFAANAPEFFTLFPDYQAAATAAQNAVNNSQAITRRALPLSFLIDEGIYLDSKTISFEASWRIITSFNNLIVATGLWQSSGLEGGNRWATSVKNISGPFSWLDNSVDPAALAIVDFGG